ncbi:hypothetical protein D3C71_2123470 [compost metagenome]
MAAYPFPADELGHFFRQSIPGAKVFPIARIRNNTDVLQMLHNLIIEAVLSYIMITIMQRLIFQRQFPMLQ